MLHNLPRQLTVSVYCKGLNGVINQFLHCKNPFLIFYFIMQFVPLIDNLILSMQKSGQWCAAHVRTAWAIHVRQQYQKQQEAAVRSSSEQFHASAKLPPLPLMSQLYAHQATGLTSGSSSSREQTDFRSLVAGVKSNADGKWSIKWNECTGLDFLE